MSDRIVSTDKPYLSREEAAVFCCVSLSQFDDCRGTHGLVPFKFMGKLVYRREDLARAMEAEWRKSMSKTVSGFSTTRRAGRGTVRQSERSEFSPSGTLDA